MQRFNFKPIAVPATAPTIGIASQHAGGNTLLKEPRRITYATPITVG
jgi:hypothetical protein